MLQEACVETFLVGRETRDVLWNAARCVFRTSTLKDTLAHINAHQAEVCSYLDQLVWYMYCGVSLLPYAIHDHMPSRAPAGWSVVDYLLQLSLYTLKPDL